MNTQFWTIPGFDNMSKQELFDMSVAHIASTRQKSMNGTECCYGGSGCAAACFLQPEKRDAADRERNWGKSSSWNSLAELQRVPAHERELVCALQRAHDNSDNLAFMPEWKSRMLVVAKNYGLSTDKLDAVPV